MKRTKLIKCLCLITVSVFLTLFTFSLTASAARYEGNTDVFAHIETSPAETTQPVTNGDTHASDQSDDAYVSTGQIVSVCVIAAVILLVISILIICLFGKKADRYTLGNGKR